MKIKVYIGVIGSGKDFSCNKDCDMRISFADPLRDDVWNLIGWKPKTEQKYEWFKMEEFGPRSLLMPSGERIGFTGREILQRHGSRMKELFGEDYWSNRTRDILQKELEKTRPLDDVIGISDARFPVEVRMLKDFGKEFGVEVEFVHCNYKSDKYDATNPQESEKLAQECLQFWGDNEAFQNKIERLCNSI